MKRAWSALLLGTVLLGMAPAPASAANGPAVYLDGYPLTFADVEPRLVNDRTMVPFRAIGEALGLSVHWIQETRTVLLEGPDRRIELQLGSPTALVNGEPFELDVPAFTENGRTLVPLRFVSEATGAEVYWESQTNTVNLTSPVRAMRGLGFYAIRSFDQRHLVGSFSDVAYGWATLGEDGLVDLQGGPDFRWPEPAGDIDGDRLLAEARQAGVRRHLMVFQTDQDGLLKPVVLNRDLHAQTAASILAVVQNHGFDGVVLDLEHLGVNEEGAELAELRAAFTHLVQTVADALRTEGRQVILSVHPPHGWMHAYDYTALAPYVDLFQLMAHDYPKENRLDPEPPDWVYRDVARMVELVGRDKVLLGVVTPYETGETLAVLAGLAKRFQLAGLSVWRLGAIDQDDWTALTRSVTLRP